MQDQADGLLICEESSVADIVDEPLPAFNNTPNCEPEVFKSRYQHSGGLHATVEHHRRPLPYDITTGHVPTPPEAIQAVSYK